MFKTIDELQKAMRSVLIDFSKTGKLPHKSDGHATDSLIECCKSGYLDGALVKNLPNGGPIIIATDGTKISQAGLMFLKETSKSRKVKNAVIETFKTVKGFVLGVATGAAATILSEWIMYKFGLFAFAPK